MKGVMEIMNKSIIKEKLKGSIIAVIRCNDAKLAEIMSEVIIQKGIKAVEITYTIENASSVIYELKKNFHSVLIGAGTILELFQAEEAIKSGADFIVTPCIVENIANHCLKNDIFCSMAASTTTEIYNAYKIGADIIKLFPGEYLNPSIIKSLRGPFPFVEFMPTGGIDDKNINEWFNNGAYAVGVGGYLTNGVNFNNLKLLEDRVDKLISVKENN